MAQMTVVDMFLQTSGYQITQSQANDYVTLDYITATYVPTSLVLFNEVTTASHTVLWTGSNASSSGNILDDRIIAEMASWFADLEFNNFEVNPETGERFNRHMHTFTELLKLRYGVRMHNGTLYLPKDAKTMKAASQGVASANKD